MDVDVDVDVETSDAVDVEAMVEAMVVH